MSTGFLNLQAACIFCPLEENPMKYDVIIVGAGPGGIFSAYELMVQRPDLKVAVFEAGHELRKRHCPIDGNKIKSCIG